MKRLAAVLVAAGFLFVTGNGFAQDTVKKTDTVTATTPVKAKAIDVGNKICPVSGSPVGDSKEVYEYKGKIYHLCCNKCPKEFQKDPEKYVKKVAEEKAAEAKAAKATEPKK